MRLPFEELQGKEILELDLACASGLFSHLHENQQKWNSQEENCYLGIEPTSVLDTRRSPNPPSSTSTLSSSLSRSGGAASVSATAASSENPSSAALEKCGLGMDDWESGFFETPPRPSQEQEESVLRLIMGDVEDPSLGFNKLLQQSGNGFLQDLDFSTNFSTIDQGFVFASISNSNGGSSNPVNFNIDPFSQVAPFCADFHLLPQNVQINNSNHPMFSVLDDAMDEKPQTFNPQLMNQNQSQFTQNPPLFMPLPYSQLQDHLFVSPLPLKRLNSGPIGSNHQAPNVPFSSDLSQQRPVKQKGINGQDELVNHQFLQQEIMEQIFKSAELIEDRNPVFAQGILARLNQQLSSPIIGGSSKPFHRAAFCFKEALQLLLQMKPSSSSPFSLVYKIGAYKLFSEISPIVQFSNFTSNQVILEAMEGFDRVHVIDFDIGYGGQWASFMQELTLRKSNGPPPFLKITAFISPSTYDEFELGFTRENMKRFASDLNISLELEIINLESLSSSSWPHSFHVSANEPIAINLPFWSFPNCPWSLPLVLQFVKQLSPKVLVTSSRGCDRTDLPFPQHIITALQSYWDLLESLDAVNMNLDIQQKIEKFLLQPDIEKIVMNCYRLRERSPSWRSLFLSYGFSPLTFSNFTEAQADCLVQRTPVRGFHIEKRKGSLVLCWQRKELVSASAWRCS